MQDDVSRLVGIEGLVVTGRGGGRVLVAERGAGRGGGLLSWVRAGFVGGQGAAGGAGARPADRWACHLLVVAQAPL